ncbi:MAG: hypothetical protein B7X41_04880 [Microbacterium sp. 14-71-5]|jgi:hypothetical protein|nr:MAG: hypothetical protein B7X41_04880 [Microbacterium sp. 14-71-5]
MDDSTSAQREHDADPPADLGTEESQTDRDARQVGMLALRQLPLIGVIVTPWVRDRWGTGPAIALLAVCLVVYVLALPTARRHRRP